GRRGRKSCLWVRRRREEVAPPRSCRSRLGGEDRKLLFLRRHREEVMPPPCLRVGGGGRGRDHLQPAASSAIAWICEAWMPRSARSRGVRALSSSTVCL